MDLNNAAMELTSCQSRIEKIKQEKANAVAQVATLQTQYNEKVGELKKLGISDVSNLSTMITQLESEIQALHVKITSELTSIESNVGIVS